VIRESKMANVSMESLGVRVRRVRRDAAGRGMLVRQVRNDSNLHRYIIVERDVHMITRSHNFEFPYSFSLDEAEEYLAKRF
jgi:hypothetical protein